MVYNTNLSYWYIIQESVSRSTEDYFLPVNQTVLEMVENLSVRTRHSALFLHFNTLVALQLVPSFLQFEHVENDRL